MLPSSDNVKQAAQLFILTLAALSACEPKDQTASPNPTPRAPAAPAALVGRSGAGGSLTSGGGAPSFTGGKAPVAHPPSQNGGLDNGLSSAPTDASECDNSPIKPNGGLVRFAVVGDYGAAGPAEEQVAKLIKSWHPEFILTTGDNNYPVGGADTIDANIGQFFHDFICPYRGGYGPGARRNRFFPALGNHDWYTSGAAPYLDYFALPGKERYYDLAWGDVHFFALDSDPSEPDGVGRDSVQAAWLKNRLATSTARWQIVTMHHPPYSSGPHLSTTYMQWPYKEWGVDLVIAGHDHIHERVTVDGLPYVVTGLGGASLYSFSEPVPGSEVRYNAQYGAGLIEADATRLVARFFNGQGERIDELVLSEQ